MTTFGSMEPTMNSGPDDGLDLIESTPLGGEQDVSAEQSTIDRRDLVTALGAAGVAAAAGKLIGNFIGSAAAQGAPRGPVPAPKAAPAAPSAANIERARQFESQNNAAFAAHYNKADIRASFQTIMKTMMRSSVKSGWPAPQILNGDVPSVHADVASVSIKIEMVQLKDPEFLAHAKGKTFTHAFKITYLPIDKPGIQRQSSGRPNFWNQYEGFNWTPSGK